MLQWLYGVMNRVNEHEKYAITREKFTFVFFAQIRAVIFCFLFVLTNRLLQVAEQLKNTPEIPQKTSKNRFPLYFVWDKKPTKKPKNFRPGPELKTVFIALEMKFAMIFFFRPGPN